MRRILLTMLLPALLAFQGLAVSYTPSLAMHTSIAICSNLSLDDEPVASRTSISVDAKLNALSMDIASVHEVSLGMKASVLSDSLVYMNSYMLGSTRFSLYAEYEAQLSSFLIGGAFGLGYGLMHRQNIGYWFLEGSLSTGFQLSPWVALECQLALLYRREYLETHMGLGFRVTVPDGLIGGAR